MASAEGLKTHFAQIAGITDLAFIVREGDGDGDGEGGERAERLLTCGADAAVQIREPGSEEVESEVAEHLDAINSIAASPVGDKFATGSDDHVVKLYSFPEGKALASVARFTLPVRTVAFDHDGTFLAAAGDDEGIKIINSSDGSIHRIIHGITSVRHIEFDPKGEFLLASTCDGFLVAYDNDAGMKRKDWGDALPKVQPTGSQMNRFAWNPDGQTVAVPGKAFDIVIYERESWRDTSTLSGGHTKAVSIVCWSPNGRYLASAGMDHVVIVWDAIKKIQVARQEVDASVCGLEWRKESNEIAMIDNEGKLLTWENVIPSSGPSPIEAIRVGDKQGAYYFDDEADDGGDLSDDMDGDDEDDAMADKKKPIPLSGLGTATAGVLAASHVAQGPIQVGSTAWTGNPPKRFLTYNLRGAVVSRDEGTYNMVEISLHDKSIRMGRIPAMSDYYGFTMAALGEAGVVLASPGSGSTQSTIMYRPFESWASSSEWELQLPLGSSFLGVAIGKGWVAAVTSENEVRMFTCGGLQTSVTTLRGGPVALVGDEQQGQYLGVVYHDGAPSDSNDQRLNFSVYDVGSQALVEEGALALSPASTLTWLGFAGSALAACDSEDVVRVRVQEFGGSWMPVYSRPSERDGHHWVVGIDESTAEISYVKCKGAAREPSVMPAPILEETALKVPLLDGKSISDALQQHVILKGAELRRVKKEEGDDLSIDDAEIAMDKCLLKLFHDACKSDKLQAALEAAFMLNRTKSVEGALKLATQMRVPALAERIGLLLQTRRDMEDTMEQPVSPRGGNTEFMQPRQTTMPSSSRKVNPFSRSNLKVNTPAQKQGEYDGDDAGVLEEKKNSVARSLLPSKKADAVASPAKRLLSSRPLNPFAKVQKK